MLVGFFFTVRKIYTHVPCYMTIWTNQIRRFIKKNNWIFFITLYIYLHEKNLTILIPKSFLKGPVKRSTGCTTITVVQPRCQYNYVYPQREYKATLNIRTCIARRFFRIYWFVRSGGRRILLNCRWLFISLRLINKLHEK